MFYLIHIIAIPDSIFNVRRVLDVFSLTPLGATSLFSNCFSLGFSKLLYVFIKVGWRELFFCLDVVKSKIIRGGKVEEFSHCTRCLTYLTWHNHQSTQWIICTITIYSWSNGDLSQYIWWVVDPRSNPNSLQSPYTFCDSISLRWTWHSHCN